MKGRAIQYSDTELAFIEQRRDIPRSELHAEFVKKFQRHDLSQANLTALCKRNGWLTGRTGRFENGIPPANKGKKMPFHPNSARTQFKKGNLPHNTKYLGHERVSTDGYIEISIDEINTHTGFNRRYVLKHVYLWEKEHGPIPQGHALKCLDGNRSNTDPSNWSIIPRSMLPRLNGRFGRGYDAAPKALKPTIMAISKLEDMVRKRRKGTNHD